MEAYVISLHENPPALKRLRDQGLAPNLFLAQRHASGGRIGCMDSHFKVYQMALRRNLSHVLIFEDDVMFTGRINFAAMHKALTIHDPDLYFLGTVGCFTIPSMRVWGTGHCFGYHQGAHAYVISRRFMQWVVSRLDRVHFDIPKFFKTFINTDNVSFTVLCRHAQSRMTQFPTVARQACDHVSTVQDKRSDVNVPVICSAKSHLWYNFGQWVMFAPTDVTLIAIICIMIITFRHRTQRVPAP